MSDFSLILESALTKPDSFFNTIIPELGELTEDKLSVLANVLENGSVIDKQLITNLFIEYLKETGVSYLTEKLDVGRPKLFIQSANIIGQLHYIPALGALKIALDKKYPDLVVAAIKAISLLPTREAVDTLADFYLKFTDEVMLKKSLRYLLTRKEELVPLFLEKYASLPAERQMFILNFFAGAADERTCGLLISELRKFPTEKGVYCMEGLGGIGTDEAVAALSEQLEKLEWFLRKHLVAALGASNNANAVEPLLKCLDDEHVLVRGAAVKSLSMVGNKNPELLISTLKNAEGQLKINLIRAMGQLKNEDFVEPLVEVLNERDKLFFSIDAVGDLGFPQAEFALRRLLKDDVWFNRLNALEALEKLNTRDLMTFAQEALEDENDMVRNSASRIISVLKAKAAANS